MEGKSQNIEKPAKQYKVFVAFKAALGHLALAALLCVFSDFDNPQNSQYAQ